jgi:REP element-mobilizing transposase RayT
MRSAASMTAPRQILPGASYLVTRRCSERRLFLRPSPTVNAIFGYLLAVAAERYGILVHVFCVLSNHYHLVVTDPGACLPEFQRYLDGLVARALNCTLGRWESFWDPDSYSAVRLEDAEDILEKIVYVLANPVAAGLVRHARHWPGLWSDPGEMGSDATSFERPKDFFREQGPMPASARLQLHRPPGFESDASLIEVLRRHLTETEERTAADRARAGRAVLGPKRVLAQSPSSHPATAEPRRTLKPRFACRNQWGRVQALRRLKGFSDAYRAALAKWRGGERTVLFPAGTWLMRIQHLALCEAC